MQNEYILHLSQMTIKHKFLRFGHNTKLWVDKNAFSHHCYTIGEYPSIIHLIITYRLVLYSNELRDEEIHFMLMISHCIYVSYFF